MRRKDGLEGPVEQPPGPQQPGGPHLAGRADPKQAPDPEQARREAERAEFLELAEATAAQAKWAGVGDTHGFFTLSFGGHEVVEARLSENLVIQVFNPSRMCPLSLDGRVESGSLQLNSASFGEAGQRVAEILRGAHPGEVEYLPRYMPPECCHPMEAGGPWASWHLADSSFHEKAQRARFEQALDAVRPFVSEGSLVVDAGCGTGGLTDLLAKTFPEASAVGVDSSPEMTAEARELVGDTAEIVRADLRDLDEALGGGQADVLIGVGVLDAFGLEFGDVKGPKGLMAAFGRAVKSGGHAVFLSYGPPLVTTQGYNQAGWDVLAASVPENFWGLPELPKDCYVLERRDEPPGELRAVPGYFAESLQW